MFIDIALIGLAFGLSIPLVNGYFAYCYGRSFWLWFLLGLFFPVIAHMALGLLCLADKKPSRRFQEHTYESLSRYEDERMQQHINAALTPRQPGHRPLD